LRIIIYEHASGGGYAEQPIPPSVLAEGYAMLRSIVADFKAAGHEITVLLDNRISKLNPPIDADFTVPIMYSGEPKRFLCNIAKINDALYIIAPETGQILQSFVKLAEGSGKISLNCTANAIVATGDKALLYETLQKFGMAPKTILLELSDGLAKIKQAVEGEIGYPAVFKPIDGVSCSGISIVTEESQIALALTKLSAESSNKRFIIQQYIQGEAASVSLLSTGKNACALSLNKQNITLADPAKASSYDGGAVPFDSPFRAEVLGAAERLVEAIPGLRGYIGVDVVYSQGNLFVVDVNPRLTTSYVGLHRAAAFNVAEALVDAVSKGILPQKVESRSHTCFLKVQTPKPTVAAFKKAAELPAVVAPPFPLDGKEESFAIVIGEGASSAEAATRLEEAKKQLQNLIS
jgi:predicted ATP-grasp superfamily ATP-dependent carboligase